MQTCYNSTKFNSLEPQIICSSSYDLKSFNKYPPHTDIKPPLNALYWAFTPLLSHQSINSSTYSSLFWLSTNIFSPSSLRGLETMLPNISYCTTNCLHSYSGSNSFSSIHCNPAQSSGWNSAKSSIPTYSFISFLYKAIGKLKSRIVLLYIAIPIILPINSKFLVSSKVSGLNQNSL